MATTQRPPPSQRKQVTILFADLSGFTTLSERLDPEEVRTLVNRYFEPLTEVVRRYGGAVDKYMGDCLMAVFGAPKAHENDPERACRAALDMMEVAKKISSDSELGLKTSALHISINSGLVVAAPVGSAEESQYTVMGDAVNVSSRLLHEAEEGEIVVGESTQEQVSGVLEFGTRTERAVRGKTGKVGFYRLLGTAEKPVARGRKLRLPLVGRQRELTLAEGLLDDTAGGRGSLLYITGDAGIGKSRLVEEIESSAKTRGFLAVSAMAEVFESLQPYDLWRQVLFSLAAEARDADARKQIGAWIQRTPELENHEPALFATCGFAAKEFELLDEESRKRGVSLAWKVLLQTLQSQRPLLIVLDDLQWADSLSVGLVDAIGDSLQALAVLICVVARPEFKPEWSTRSYSQQITLRPLSSEESVSLVHEVLGQKNLDEAQEKWVAERAEGNPFYVAELTRVVAERGITELPPTVQGIILQRVDRLEWEAQQVLQVASVIGREFPEKVLRAVADGEELEGKLEKLRRLEFIYEKQIVPELQYIFKHFLTLEATYNSILIERRKQLHKQVAGAIETIYKESLERYYAVLAQHLERAGEYEKAFDYYRLAGEQVQQAQSDTAATELLQRGEKALDELYEGRTTLSGKWKSLTVMGILGLIGFFGGYFMRVPWERAKLLFLQPSFWLGPLTLGIAFVALVVWTITVSSRRWRFIIYPQKIRLLAGRRSADIPFEDISEIKLLSWKVWSLAGILNDFYYIDPRYRSLGFSLKLTGWGHRVSVRCKTMRWRRGYYLNMDGADKFYKNLKRALERYRAIHVTSASTPSSAA